MATNLALDDRLITAAVKAGGHQSKREAVNAALADYVRAKKRAGLDALIGTVDYYGDAPGVVRANKRRAKPAAKPRSA